MRRDNSGNRPCQHTACLVCKSHHVSPKLADQQQYDKYWRLLARLNVHVAYSGPADCTSLLHEDKHTTFIHSGIPFLSLAMPSCTCTQPWPHPIYASYPTHAPHLSIHTSPPLLYYQAAASFSYGWPCICTLYADSVTLSIRCILQPYYSSKPTCVAALATDMYKSTRLHHTSALYMVKSVISLLGRYSGSQSASSSSHSSSSSVSPTPSGTWAPGRGRQQDVKRTQNEIATCTIGKYTSNVEHN